MVLQELEAAQALSRTARAGPQITPRQRPVNTLEVAARTSAFSFKGKDTDIGTIARKLSMGAVPEGSVRRSGHSIRITAQLITPLRVHL